MSDIGLKLPWWIAAIALGFDYWPAVLAVVVVSGAIGLWVRGAWRFVAFSTTTFFAVGLAFTGFIFFERWRDTVASRAYESSVQSVLDAPRLIDGLELPAGTSMRWMEPEHLHVQEAFVDGERTVLGLHLKFVSREDDGWSLMLAGPQAVEGWSCEEYVHVSADGHLRACKLEAGRSWQGWELPAKTSVEFGHEDGTVGFVLPDTPQIMASEIGRALPATGLMSMNADGSLNHAYFEQDDPLMARGIALSNQVRWQYAPGTFGQGRRRAMVSVRGFVARDVVQHGETITLGSDLTVPLSDGR